MQGLPVPALGDSQGGPYFGRHPWRFTGRDANKKDRAMGLPDKTTVGVFGAAGRMGQPCARPWLTTQTLSWLRRWILER